MDQDGQGGAGGLIRGYRKAAGLTQQELADAAGVSIGVVRDLEQRRTARPQAESVRRLTTALSLDRSQAVAFSRAGREAPEAQAPGWRGLLRLGVLGPVQARRGAAPISLGAPMQRAVLGLLALYPESGLRRSALIDALWGDDPPATAAAMVQSYVSRLRHALGGSRQAGLLAAVSGRYRLDAEACEIDHVVFATLVSQARGIRTVAGPAAASVAYTRALALWRGDPLGGVDTLREHPAVIRLNLLRAEAVTEYAEAASAAGWHDRVLGELQALTSREPLNERAHAQLMVALAGSGRQADALGVYEQLRRRLDEQLGIGPGAELADAHSRVLRQDITGSGPARGAVTAPVRGHSGSPEALGPGPSTAAGTRAVVPRQLPAGAPHFAGRVVELAALTGMLGQGADAPARVTDASGGGTVVISAIGGMAGVGKTALALEFAHRIVGRFPDGQLYLNLRGFDPAGDPLTAEEAVRAFLNALQVPPEQIPAAAEAQEGLYRSLLAGRRMLIVLDNAADAAQVRPLLPGRGGCLVVVTSRRQVAGLAATHGAHLLSLDVLHAAEARDLLGARLGTTRAASEPAAIAELAELCSRLPLALSIAAALAAARPDLSLAALVAELQNQRRRLDVLNAGDATASVRAVFSWSHDRLSDPAARMFRLLGLHPGPDVTIPAAASMAGISSDDARQLMAELTDSNLLTEHMPGRFAFHDLMHAYAGDRAQRQDGGKESRAAVQRGLDFYLQTARAADRLLNPAREPASLMISAQPGVILERIDGIPRALAWLTAEHSVLLAAVRWAADARFDVHARELAAAMVTYLDRQGHLRDYAVTQVTALAAAQRAGDLPGRARAHLDLAGAFGRLGEHDRARDNFLHALSMFQDLGDCGGQGRARLSLGWVLNETGEHAQALAHCQDALELFRASSEPVWQARALGAVGWCGTLLGDHARALAVCHEAVGLHRELGDKLGEAAAWESLGDAHHHLGQHHKAVACFRRSVLLYAGLGEHYYNAEALSRIGDSYQAVGDLHAARDAWQQALAILEDHHLPNTAELRAKLMDVGSPAARAEARGRSVRLDQ